MITFWGIVMAIVFLGCYLGQSVSSGMEGPRAKMLQWGCLFLAGATMVVCYLFTRVHTG